MTYKSFAFYPISLSRIPAEKLNYLRLFSPPFLLLHLFRHAVHEFWEARKEGGAPTACELRFHGESFGWEAQILKDSELFYSRSAFITKAAAIEWANAERRDLEKATNETVTKGRASALRHLRGEVHRSSGRRSLLFWAMSTASKRRSSVNLQPMYPRARFPRDRARAQ